MRIILNQPEVFDPRKYSIEYANRYTPCEEEFKTRGKNQQNTNDDDNNDDGEGCEDDVLKENPKKKVLLGKSTIF